VPLQASFGNHVDERLAIAPRPSVK
jgi:hypothetical protein